MNESFEYAFTVTASHEGGYVNAPYDPGGETKYGISKRSYPELDIPNLTLEQARCIYYRDYWLPLKLDEIKHTRIAAEIFDTAVNMGLKTATKIAQRALNFLGEDLKKDGILGAKTSALINKWSDFDRQALYKALNGEQYIQYKNIIKNRPNSQHFARGWMKRIQDWYIKGGS